MKINWLHSSSFKLGETAFHGYVEKVKDDDRFRIVVRAEEHRFLPGTTPEVFKEGQKIAEQMLRGMIGDGLEALGEAPTKED